MRTTSVLLILSIALSVQVAAGTLTATPNPFTLSNGTIDVGQVSIANTIVSGGAGAPYTGEWTFLNSNSINNQVVNTITGATNPYGVAFNPSGTLAYVANSGGTTVIVINVASNTVTNTIAAGINPLGVAFNPSGTLAYVTNDAGTTVSVINVASNTVTNTITVGSGPYGVAINPSGTLAYVVNSATSGTVSVINMASNTVTNTITVGSNPHGVAINPSGTLAYVANYGGGVSVINVASNTVTNTIAVGADPESVAINPSGTLAYVTNSGGNTVSVINIASNTVTNTITVGSGPYGVTFNPSGTLAYVTNHGSGTVSVINVASNTVTSTITVGTSPEGVAINPSGTLAYVTNWGSSTVSVIGNLPETSLQTMPSNNLQLTVNAVSSNSISFTFNGVAYTDSTGSNTIYGTWSLYGFGEDSNGYYEDSSTPINIGNTVLLSNTIVVDSALTAPAAPMVSATKLDVDQALTANGVIPTTGTSTYTWQFLTSINGGAFTAANAIAVCPTSNNGIGAAASATESCSVSASTLTAGNTYAFEFKVTDSANTPETQTSSASSNVVVANALTASAAPSVSATKLDVDQALTANGVIPTTGTSTYTWQFLTSINGGAFTTANAIAACPTSNNGIGAAASATESCSVSASTLTGGNTYAFEFKVTDSANTPETQTSSASSNVVVASALQLLANPLHVVVGNASIAVVQTKIGGTTPYSFAWYNGAVLGGYEQFQLSLIPPYGMPTPPLANTLPTQMFRYQNPGSTNAITPYVWNGTAFNAIATNNANAIVAGNEDRLPAFLPNLFTLTSNVSGIFHLVNLPANALTPSQNPSSQVIYDLDAYSLAQSNTLNTRSVYTSNNPSVMANLASHHVGLNVTLTNIGVSANYISPNTFPLGFMISGFALNGTGQSNFYNEFVVANSLPSKGNTISIHGPNGGVPGLLGNITGVYMLGPPLPAPGITLNVYDSVNTLTMSSDTGNNILMATFTYNGPKIIYNTTSGNYLGAVPATGNVLSYTGENGIAVSLTLVPNTLVQSTVPTSQAIYFTFNTPEITSSSSNTPGAYVLFNLTNASMVGGFPEYTFASSPNSTNVAYLSSGTSSPLHQGGSTARGSVLGPITPMSLLYFMASNVISFNSIPFTTSNSFTFNSVNSNYGPNIFRVNITDSANTAVTKSEKELLARINPIQAVNTTITPNTLTVGQTALATIKLSGGQPPFTGYWNLFPHGGTANSLSHSLVLTLPTNEITLGVNVTSQNTIRLTPTFGTNATSGGGRNNSFMISIANGNATISFPSTGGSHPSLTIATGLSSNTVFGLWNANSTVNSTDPSVSFSIVQTTTTTIPHGGGGGAAPSTTMSVGDNANTSAVSNVSVVRVSIFSYSTGQLVSTESFNQDQLPAGITVPNGDYANMSFACMFSAGGMSYGYAGEVYGLGSVACDTTSTISSPSFTIIYSASPAQRSSSKVPASSSTTIPARPIEKPLMVTDSTEVSVNVSASSSQPINFTIYGVHVIVSSNSSTAAIVNVTVKNASSYAPARENHHILKAFNISAPGTTLNVTLHYNCSAQSYYNLEPVIYLNGSWTPISPFTSNGAACTISFSVPGDPLVALVYQNGPPTTVTTSVPTTAQTSATTTTILPPQAAPQPNTSAYIAVAIAVVIIVAAAAYYLTSRKKRD